MKIVNKILHILNRKKNPPNWIGLRNTVPFEKDFGLHRGTPIDRYYIEKFLRQNQQYITGDVLEIGENTYTQKFRTQVEQSIVLHYDSTDKNATLIGDLTKYKEMPPNLADCFICTQTLNFVFDIDNAVGGIKHLLKPGGTALVTVAGLCQISQYDYQRWGDFWRFTKHSATMLFSKHFPQSTLQVMNFGNVLAATCLLQGITVEDITEAELNVNDDTYQVVICIVATKENI